MTPSQGPMVFKGASMSYTYEALSKQACIEPNLSSTCVYGMLICCFKEKIALNNSSNKTKFQATQTPRKYNTFPAVCWTPALD